MIVTIGFVFISSLVLYSYGKCRDYFHEKEFLASYELEDFSQFKGVDMILRGADKQGNFLVFGFASNLVKDTSIVLSYAIILNRENCQIVKIELAQKSDHLNADTLKLQGLAQKFMQYEIPRLDVDTAGNVFVYLKDFETLALVRFVNDSELQKHSKETKWSNIRGNWYK